MTDVTNVNGAETINPAQGEPPQQPRKFLLATAFPKTVLKDQKKTLRQLKLLPSAVLTVCPE